MIDDAGKQRLTLSFYAYAQIQIQHNSVTIYPSWNPLEVLGRICAKEGKTPTSLPADNFYAFKDSIETYAFRERLNIAVEQDDHLLEINHKSP
jgi:UPF0176 protein